MKTSKLLLKEYPKVKEINIHEWTAAHAIRLHHNFQGLQILGAKQMLASITKMKNI